MAQQLRTQVARYTAVALVWLVAGLVWFGLLAWFHWWPCFFVGSIMLGLATYSWWRARLSAGFLKALQ